MLAIKPNVGARVTTTQSPEGDDGWSVEDATIVFADVVDSVGLIEQDEQRNVRRIRDLLSAVCDAVTGDHGATLLERRGDGVLLKFANPGLALRAALHAHSLATAYSDGRDAADRLMLRIGIHTARLLADATAAYGIGVNTAARVTSLAQPGETALSAAARDQVIDGLEAQLEDLGDCIVKGSASPIRVYRAGPASSDGLSLPTTAPSATVGVPTLAVLPFAVMSANGDDGAVGELLAEAITSRLSRTSLLRITSRLSARAIRHTTLPLPDVCSRLNADYLISGSIRLLAGSLNVYVELSDGRNDQVIWADRLTGTVDDLLSSQSELAEQISASAQSRIVDEQLAQLRQQPLPTLNSYTLYLGGTGMMHRQSRSDFEQSRKIFDYLKSRHPRSAIPRAWLGKWHMLKVVQGWSDEVEADTRLAGLEAARALEIEPNNSLCATVRGVVYAYLSRDFSAAQACYDHALAQNPSDALAHLQQAALSGWLGQAGTAASHATQALQLSPLDPHLYFMHSLAAGAWLGAGDLELAEAHALRSIQANCMHVATYKVLAITQALQGKLAAAKNSVGRVLQLSPDFTLDQFQRRSPWAVHPRFDDFRKALAGAGVAEHQ